MLKLVVILSALIAQKWPARMLGQAIVFNENVVMEL
jgi:hypothetical protein